MFSLSFSNPRQGQGLTFSVPHSSPSVKPPKPPAIGPWTQSENDSLALFLSSSDPDHYTTKDENGLDIFDSFSTTKVPLSFLSYRLETDF